MFRIIIVGARIKMKQIQISMIFFATILFCGIIMAGTTNTYNVVTVESTQSRLQPQTGVTYLIVANWIYKTDEPGPAEIKNAYAWSLANEFVFRTNLRELFVLPSLSSGKRKEDALYLVIFARKAGGKQLTLLVDPKSKTVQIKEDD